VFQIGDGGNGGGVVLRDVKWGARALAAAEEVLAEHFGDDIAMFAFKVSPKGYVYVRLDRLTARFVSSQLSDWRQALHCLLGLIFSQFNDALAHVEFRLSVWYVEMSI
jgi:hypothetical protein